MFEKGRMKVYGKGFRGVPAWQTPHLDDYARCCFHRRCLLMLHDWQGAEPALESV